MLDNPGSAYPVDTLTDVLFENDQHCCQSAKVEHFGTGHFGSYSYSASNYADGTNLESGIVYGGKPMCHNILDHVEDKYMPQEI